MKKLKVLMVVVPIFLCTIGVISLFLFVNATANAAREAISTENTILNDSYVDRWQVFPDTVRGRGDPGVVAVDGKIYVISGFWVPGKKYVYNQEVFDPQTNTWQSLGMIPEPRSDFVALNYKDKIYTIGGWRDPIYQDDYDKVGSLEYNHMYHPITDTWEILEPLTVPVSGAAGVVLNDMLYVIGGYKSDEKDLDLVQIYDPVDNSWTQGKPMNFARSEFGAVVLNGLIYVVGGNKTTGSYDIEIYDPVLDMWSAGPPLPEPRLFMAVAVRQGEIYVIGGVDKKVGGEIKDTMYVLDPDTGTWTIGAPMPTARRACRAAVVNDKIYVIGGVGEFGAGTANEVYGLFPPLVYIPLLSK